MEVALASDERMTSAAAFVEGGVQEACDDACSICLEDFSNDDPSTVTKCRHEFHLQCILEWCRRSSNCPMCWQPVSLKDATSQELLEAVEQERKLNLRARVHQRPSRVDFGSQHVIASGEIEESILQHLAAATARRRDPHYTQAHNRPFFVLASSRGTVGGQRSDPRRISPRSPSIGLPNSPGARELPASYCPLRRDRIPLNRNGSNICLAGRLGFLPQSHQSSPQSHNMAGPSESLRSRLSPSESLRSRLSDWSTRYRDSFSRGWKERLFARSNSSSDFSPRGRSHREGSPVISNSNHATHSNDSKASSCAPSSPSA